MVSELTAMDLANASLLDEATAAAEAMTLLHRVGRGRQGDRFAVDEACHPQTIAVVEARAEPIGLEVVVCDPATADLEGVFGLLVQYPGTTGAIPDLRSIIERAHGANTLVAVAADPLALCVLTPPGEMGADVVVGSTQRFGVPMSFGGPHAAYIAVREEYQRALPGRLVGVSKDDAAARRCGWPSRPASSTSAGEGHLQHLHLPGAAGGDGVDVRHPSRTRGDCPRSRGGSTGWPPSWPTGCGRTASRSSTTSSSTRCASACPAGPTR